MVVVVGCSPFEAAAAAAAAAVVVVEVEEAWPENFGASARTGCCSGKAFLFECPSSSFSSLSLPLNQVFSSFSDGSAFRGTKNGSEKNDGEKKEGR